jgi:hypothetical protein
MALISRNWTGRAVRFREAQSRSTCEIDPLAADDLDLTQAVFQERILPRTGPGPVIEIPQPACHDRRGARTFVMFERLPWCRRCFLARVEGQ